MAGAFIRAIIWVALAAGPATAAAQPRGFASAVPAIRVTPTGVLPHGPGQPLDDYCTDKVVTPRGAAARAVAARGWLVTGEERLGRLTAVSFVGGLRPGMSGTCLIDAGNVGLFDGERLRAIVHGGQDGAQPRRVTATTVPDRLRIWSEEYSPPLADIVARGEGAAVVSIAASESWCGGIAVPNVYGLTIEAARRRILAVGWRPAPPPAADIAAATGGRDLDFRRAGLTEVEVCSGTGFGLCLFNYRHPRGARLEIQTAGEESEIVGQWVTCAAQRGRRRR